MPAKKENYENMLSKLETIIRDMEDGSLTLEKTLKNYEDGMALYNKLYKMLNEAEGKIKIVAENGEEDFLKESEKDE